MRRLYAWVCIVVICLLAWASPVRAAPDGYSSWLLLTTPAGHGSSLIWLGGVKGQDWIVYYMNQQQQLQGMLHFLPIHAAYNAAAQRLCFLNSGGQAMLFDPATQQTLSPSVSTALSVTAVNDSFWIVGPTILQIVDAKSGLVRQQAGLPPGMPGQAVATSQAVWVVLQDTSRATTQLARIDQTTLQAKSYLLIQGSTPYVGLAKTPDGTVYAQAQGTIYRFDPASDSFVPLPIKGLPPIPIGPDNIWTDTTGSLWVAMRSQSSTSIAQIDQTTGLVSKKTTLPKVYTGIVYDPVLDLIWLQDSSNGPLTAAKLSSLVSPPVGTITLPPDTTSRDITVTLSAHSDSGVTDMQIDTDSGFSSSQWQPYATTATWHLTSGDGPKTLYARFRDAFGNVSDPISASTTLHEVQLITEKEPNISPATATPVPTAVSTSDLSGHLMAADDVDYFTITPNQNAAFVLQKSDPTLTVTLLDAQQTVVAQSPVGATGSFGAPATPGRAYFIRITGPADTMYTIRSTFVANVHDSPTISIQSPADGATVAGTVAAQASVAAGSTPIWKVQWQVDHTLMATNLTPPYSFSWDATKADNGAHLISAVAYDAAGNQAQSDVHVIVNNLPPDTTPPTITATLPNTTASPAVTLQLSATDDLPGPIQVQIANTADFATAQWQPIQAAMPWTLPSGDGPKTVYVRARDQAGNVSQPVAVATVLDSQHEPDETMDQATDLAIGQDMTGRIATPTDVDFFRLQPNARGWLQVTVTGTAASLDLLGSDGKVLCSGNPCSLKAQASQTYFARLQGAADPVNDYHIHAALVPADDDTLDTAASAAVPGSLYGLLKGPGDLAFYRLQPGDTGHMTLQLTAPQSLGATVVVLDSAGNPLKRDPDGTYAVTKGSSYYCKVQGTGWSSTDPYRLDIGMTVPPPPSDGSTLNGALPLSTGDLKGSMPPDASILYYRFTPSADGVLTVRLDSGPVQDLDLHLLDSSGNELAASTAGLGIVDVIDYSVHASQSYYIAVTYFAGRRTPFQLSTQLMPPDQAPDRFDPNNTLTTAAPLTIGDTVHARVANPAEVDYFQINAVQAGTLTVDLTPPATAELDLKVLDQNGTVLASSSAGLGLPQRITLPVTAAQHVFAAVSYNSGLTPAPYTLHTTFQTAPGTANNLPPNHTLPQAAAFTGSVTSEITNPSTGDYYKWTAAKDGPAKFRLAMSPHSDLDLEILDSSGQVVASSTKGLGMPEECTIAASAGTSYFIHITYYSGTTPASYTLTQTNP